VVVDNFDIEWARLPVGPFKADSPSIIDSDAELASSVSSKRFKSVALHALKLSLA
jgi:hypothetical protein